jgi:gamma-glutamyltranspeptidase/glutathione hydrolase
MYGAVGGEANAIEPGKRMLSSMCPVLVLKDGKPFLVAGTPGGTTIPTSMIQTIINIIDFNQSVADAVNNPKFHHQWLPDVVMVEKNFPAATREKLQQMGYTIKEIGGLGRVEAIRIKDSMEAAADIRGDDSVAGY